MTASISSNIFNRIWQVWPVIACSFGMTIVATLGFVAAEYRGLGRAQWYVDTAVLSFLFGEIAFATILGGLITRHWLTGWSVAVLLASIQTVMAMVIAHFPNLTSPPAKQQMALCSLWPVLLLSTCAPLVMLRTLWGWTLARQSESAIPRWRSSLEDLLLVGVVIACSITTAQMFLFSEGPQTIPEMLMVMGLFAATSFICIPPVVYISFRSSNWPRRLLGWFVLSAIVFVLMLIEQAVMEGEFNGTWSNLFDLILGVAVGCTTVAVGITSLMASGYQLTHFRRISESQQSASQLAAVDHAVVSLPERTPNQGTAPFAADWLDDSQPTAPVRSFEFNPQWQARVITLLLVAVAALGGLGIHFEKQRTIRFYEELRQPKIRQAYMTQDSIDGLDFGPEFVDGDLKDYLKYRNSIRSLSFSGTKITDALLPELKAFPGLRELDLSSTAITDAGLQQLELPTGITQHGGGLQGFHRLSLADTNVTWSGAQRLAERSMILYFDLSGLHITDSNLATRIPTSGLTLSRNPITDAGLRTLISFDNIHSLDVSDTAITGDTLNTTNCPGSLNLDGTRIDDKTLTLILRTGQVAQLSLRRTKVTAATLPLLSGLTVRLGQGAITESDLAAASPMSFQHLGLNDKQFTGMCITTGNLSTSSLDLSDSSVSDDTLMAIGGKGTWYQFFGLANTNASDACMPYLRSVAEIDLRGTRVTMAGLTSRLGKRVVISQDQFSPRDLATLRNSKTDVSGRPRSSLGMR